MNMYPFKHIATERLLQGTLQHPYRWFVIVPVCIGCISQLPSITDVSAQTLPISGDGTLPTPTEVVRSSDGLQFDITGGSTAGDNLFHSFSTFSVPNGTTASFQLPTNLNIRNVIGRVTGSLPSAIDGIVELRGPATLFLLNPNGIIFGPDSELNLGGSFVSSTAESIRFADGLIFSTNLLQTSPLLSINVPNGLQFGSASGPIINRSLNANTRNIFATDTTLASGISEGGLAIQPGNTLALIGGPIQIESGRLTANGGRIELGSAGDNSTVEINQIEQGWEFTYGDTNNLNDITLERSQSSDALSLIDASDGGSIAVQGRNIFLLEGSELLSFVTQAQNVEMSGGITLVASESIEIVGTSITMVDGRPFTFASAITTQVGMIPQLSADIRGTGGDIDLRTSRLLVRDGGVVSTGTLAPGNAGNLRVKASFVEISGVRDGLASQLTASTSGSGNGGQLILDTGQLVVQDGGQILASTFGPGIGGQLSVMAQDFILVTGSNSEEEASLISVSSASRNSEVLATGNSGELSITTSRLTVQDNAEIRAESLGEGQGGILTINADNVLLNQGSLTAETAIENGGNINLNIAELLQLSDGSGITAEAGRAMTGTGSGGIINIDALLVVATPNSDSDIVANSFGGAGGDINITTLGLFGLLERPAIPNNGTNDIDASSDFGVDGQIQINTLVNTLNSGLLQLPESVSDPSQKIATGCAAQQGSRFVLAGRGGVPTDPTASLSNQPLWQDLRDPNASRVKASPPIAAIQSLRMHDQKQEKTTLSIVEATGWQKNWLGQLELSNKVVDGPSLATVSPASHCKTG